MAHGIKIIFFQDMVNQVDKDATGDIKFPNFLGMMCQKFSDNNAEDEIREAFKVFDNVSSEYDSGSSIGIRKYGCYFVIFHTNTFSHV